MSEAYSAPQHLAKWNRARGVWETDQQSICGHSELFSQTWPTSGMTRSGSAYELPTWERATADSESSYLPTPRATDGSKGGPNQRGSSGDLMLPSAVALLPTPEAKLGSSGPDYARASRPGTGGDSLHEAVGRMT
jgi:hypothetical protein